MIDAKPLALRLRPESLDEIIGQEHILGPGKMLTKLIQSDSFGSLIYSCNLDLNMV